MGFSRQEYWSGLPFPSPGNLPDPGIESVSPTLQADALPSETQGVRDPCDPADAASPHSDCWGAGGMQEARWTRKQDGPQTVLKKGMNSESTGLHLPLHRMLNCLSWYLIFDGRIAWSLCRSLAYRLTSHLAFLEQFSQSYWGAVS